MTLPIKRESTVTSVAPDKSHSRASTIDIHSTSSTPAPQNATSRTASVAAAQSGSNAMVLPANRSRMQSLCVETSAMANALSAASSSAVGKCRAISVGGPARNRSMSLAQAQESAKEKQLRAKEAREDRKSRLDLTHRHIIEVNAMLLGLQEIQVEEHILDCVDSVDIIDELFAKNGSKVLMMYYQDADPPGPEAGRLISAATRGTTVKRIIIANETNQPAQGICVFFCRDKNDTAITMKNLGDELRFGSFRITQDNGEFEGSVLTGLQHYLGAVYNPVLRALKNWGQIEDNSHHIKEFITNMSGLETFLEAVQTNLNNRVVLKQNDELAEHLATPKEVIATAGNPELVEQAEELVLSWCKQMETVLVQSEQMRKEGDDTGPLAELEHWRHLTTKFNDMVEQIKSKPVQMVLQVLIQSKSKVFKTWRDIDMRVTDAANESRDNLKFLHSLEKFCRPLYASNPTNMREALPSLIGAIRLINTISRYYNTSERMTSLFVKVTNQMVNSCKSYITDDGTSDIWEQPYKPLVQKLRVCINLYRDYQAFFHKTKHRIQTTPDEKPFEFSEMYIFGKFEAFCKRLEKIINILDTVERLTVLTKSRIEGIEVHGKKFTEAFNTIKKKTYDFLDPRKLDFDQDYEVFQNQIFQLEKALQAFMDKSFNSISSASDALRLMHRFELLKLDCLELGDKYAVIIEKFTQEIRTLRLLYDANKDDPVLSHNMPPVAGKIAWARNLYRRMREIMEFLRAKHPDTLEAPEARSTIRQYNQLSKCLIRYEILYHEAWTKSVDEVRNGLMAPILVRHPKTKELIPNYDPLIPLTIREADCMRKMGLKIPVTANVLSFRKERIFDALQGVQDILERSQRVNAKIPELFAPMLSVLMHKVDKVMQPGLISLTWTSLTLPEYFESVHGAIDELELMITRLTDIKEQRIDSVLDTIAGTLLVDLPVQEPYTTGEFLSKLAAHSERASGSLDFLSFKVEHAVYELVDIFLQNADVGDAEPPSREVWQEYMSLAARREAERDEQKRKSIALGEDQMPSELSLMNLDSRVEALYETCRDLYTFFNTKNSEALVRATKYSLDAIKKRVFLPTRSMLVSRDDEDTEELAPTPPFLLTDIILAIPNIVLSPSMDDVQTVINKAAQMVLEVNRGIALWGQQRSFSQLKISTELDAAAKEEEEASEPAAPAAPSEETEPQKPTEIPRVKLHTYYRSVREHKDTGRMVMMLQTALSAMKQEINNVVQNFQVYSFLWEKDRNQAVEEFMETQPSLTMYRAEISKCRDLRDEVAALDDAHRVGPLQLSTEPLKMSLTVEIDAWTRAYASQLHQEYSIKLDDVTEFFKENSHQLAKPIKDLDDVRNAMECLKTVRERQIEIDMLLGPVEEAYALFNKFEIPIPKEEAEKVDGLRYAFEKLIQQSIAVQDYLSSVQDSKQNDLTTSIEVFKTDLAEFNEQYEYAGPMEVGIPAQEASDRLALFQSRFDDLWHKFQVYTAGERLFGMPESDYPSLHVTKKELNLLQKLYGLYNEVMKSVNGYYDTAWPDIDIEQINAELIDFQNRCRKMPKALQTWPAYTDLKKRIDDFNETCPLLEMMANKSMMERHWDNIAKLTNCTFEPESDSFMLRNVMEAPLLEFKDDIEDICIGATKEKDIESKLKGVIAEWALHDLACAQFKNRGELLLKGQETAEIIALMEDSLMILGSLLSNRYNAPYKKQIQLWVQNLSNTSEILDNWMTVQNLWVYLEAVFVGGDIAKQLPKEAKRFQTIDKSWVRIMTRAHDITNAVDCCVGDETLGQLLPHLLEQLEVCQKSLTGYLEGKRLVFPRFFFISDPSLLEILGQASDPHTIQAHLLGIFENVATVEFHAKDYDRIVAVLSREKERVELEKTVKCEGNVEVWLGQLLKEQQSSLHGVIREAYQQIMDPDFEIMTFLSTFPAQVGLLGLQIIWTRDAEVALNNAKFDRDIMPDTNKMFLTILNRLIDMTTQELTKFERVKYETLITIHVHQRDIFDGMVKMHVKTVNDFEWAKQSRFYFEDDEDVCLVKITDIDFIYQNEFLGCTDRLVITPLTDRCYITIAQAVGMSMGSAPAGPAGTGKTETTKDMGKALGKYVVVFNCSDQMDFRGLGRIYKGLAQSGSWGCFDEFNRIELPVLSVAAQQIHIVFNARKERKTSFIFSDGDNVSLNPEFTIIITMNPGYAGRQELPENLKIQFRTVAMMVPDRQIIMRVKLASCGFRENINLARKFFVLYKLCEEQLSKQVHYDFGLRNILSVLRTLGSQKRSRPDEPEEMVVMRVLRDMNVSKLVDEDEPLFLSLITDLFPGMQLEKVVRAELMTAIANQVQLAGMVNHPQWNLKLIQLYETSLVRHGLMTLGPTGAGKTACIHMLMKAMTETGAPHKEMRMNPKAITAPQMFGRLDVATNDWTDGIFSTLWRRSHKVKKGENIWLVLDGPVDAVWIENLNSVLDDNKTLTLANGDRITMAPTCKLLFEPDNVDNASPATISRMGMVFMSASVLGWKPILKGWLNTRQQAEAEILWGFYDAIFDDLLNYVRQELLPKMFTQEANYTTQSTDLLTGLIMEQEDKDKSSPLPAEELQRLFLFSVMWSLGALLELDMRAKMEEFARSHPSELDWPVCAEDETIFEFRVNPKGEWEHWRNYVSEYEYPTDSVPEFSSILVPNVDNVRTSFLMNTITKQNKCALLIGEPGTAKTVMIKSALNSLNPEEHLFKCINFSSATTPMMYQRTIESYVDKRMGTTYGPPSGRKMTVFIDDINMPDINEWGDQVCNEIVRQLMEQKGFYSLEKPGDFTHVVDTQFLAAMIHPGGGRNDIPPRLKRRFAIFNCTLPSVNSMDQVFRVISTGYFSPSRFPENIVEFIPSIVPMTRKVWQMTKVKMLPTPAKFHYVFNLRDLSRIYEGILKVVEETVRQPEDILIVWKHECIRVIADRFTSEADKTWFQEACQQVAGEDLDEDLACVVKNDHYFVDFLRDAPEPTGEEPDDFEFEVPHVYEPIESFDALEKRLRMFQDQYNEAIRGAAMDMVFFVDAMVHLVKISRVLRTPRGNVLLVGVGGSGKQSLTRLASFIAGYQTFQITLTRAYSASNLMDDLKILYRVAGKDGKGITFVFTDNEIKEESFLEYLNNMISTGEISNLFARDEMDEITNELIPVMKKEEPRTPPTPDNLYNFFISRARSNIHVCLCFSPVGEKFRSRALKFPGLISGCTMDWFSRWPPDALVAVSHHFISGHDIVCTDEVKDELIKSMGFVHDGVAKLCTQYFERFRRQTHVTPKSYLSFLDGYKAIYTQKHEEINELARRMNMGLTKLVEATASVNELAVELEKMTQTLAVASAEAEQVLAEVTQSASAAEKVKAEVQVVKDGAEALVSSIAVSKGIAEEKLEAARPALEDAERALDTITGADISTVRKLGKPPHLIMRIMDCALLLFQRHLDPVTPDPDRPCLKPSWGDALKLMSNTQFLQMLKNFPKDTINDEVCELMEPYFAMEDYTLESAKKVCGNVAGLLSWTLAMSVFFGINKEVLPLKAMLAVEEGKLAAANAELAEAQTLLDAKQKELDEVQAKFDVAMAAKQKLEDDANRCQRKMDNASTLINGLSGEKVRWTAQSEAFKQQTEWLVGDVLMLTGFLSYAGPFNQEFRTLLIKQWEKELKTRRIPCSEDLSIIGQLSDPPTVAEWNLQGLPNDDLSTQNGIIVTKASRFPLLIDPQSQGKVWVKNKEKDNELIVTFLNHKYFRNHLEDALSLGKPMIIEDVGEELDPALDNVLEKNFIKSGTSLKVKLGDKEVDFMKGFRLYITTKLGNPTYSPEVSARASIIDFTVTMKGLEDQLLGRVIGTEKQELERERTKLVEDVTDNKRKIKELEDNLLYKLTSTQGSLVEDESLIAVLANTKETAADVHEKLKVAAETELKINEAREEFRPVATRGSILYFHICEMAMVNSMYQTSLVQFLGIFDRSMTESEKSPIPQRRIGNIIEYLNFASFQYTCRGLYECDKFLFTLLMALKVDLNRRIVKYEEFQVLIKGGAALDLNNVTPKPCRWISDLTWLNLVELSKLPYFHEILNQVPHNEKTWRAWFEKEAPEEEVIPDGYHTSLDTFRRLLLIRSWCPDRTIAQARKYVAESLGARYTEPIILNLEMTWNESSNRIPLVNLLSTGSDPTPMIEALAKKQGIACSAVSMGQGQEIHARRIMTEYIADGGWVLLQNCHLCLDFVSEVVTTLIETEGMDDRFRMWITTEPHPKFPISLLQMAIKFTNEPPQGIKAGLQRTYHGISQELLDYTNYPQWRPMLYGVSFLHTIVQERRKFGPLGWNIPYEFNQADWSASVQFVQNHLDDIDPKKGVSWITVRYMLGEVQYGGRVTDDFDKRLLVTFAKVWFSDAMFNEQFCFYQGYGIPRSAKHSEVMAFIDDLPAVDAPQAYGLNTNADITYQTNTTKALLDTILAIQPKESSAGGGETRESIVYRQADEMLSKMPDDYVPHEVKARLQTMGALTPMNIFLRQELDRMQKVITAVRKTLSDLKLAIDGTIIMNENLRDALDNIFDAKVPALWNRISWQSTTIGFWFTELLERNNQFNTWIFQGRPNVFWMTGFFNPQGFLTAMRQEVTRAHKGWSLDSVVLANEVLKVHKEDVDTVPPEGVLVHGLFLDGAGWDKKNCRLAESQPKVLFVKLPVVHIFAVNNPSGRESKLYKCPVYKKPNRTDLNYITLLTLRTVQTPDHWVLRGVALLCDVK
ncbi:LOW QUALITY PROTEIN: dynein heavy chain 8, axonemal-like [Pollicipes pollicipes]|uniref:LOW QUALITY PROTEIN: dynein heavy chain 8, axonemal-like n=1 Tax=Pollicipes pollicipes TaxID=41117 RepID=UPI0018851B85|nr:LOW QUALITY PROTEIN: dynein heavy chain 8, axonemal-like [Pollicipes pollicipes]